MSKTRNFKTGLAVLAIIFGFSSAASAQTATAAQRGGCKDDYEKFCKGTAPGGGRIVACLNKQRDKLSETCKKVIDTRK
jgi:hypothetical protein